MLKNHTTLKRITIAGLLSFVAMVISLASQSVVHAGVTPGCEPSRPYNCAMSRRNFDQEVANWCSLAKPDKQAECKLKFYSFVYTTQADVKAHAGFTIPSYCGTEEAKTNKSAADTCYVIAKQSTKYYAATKQLAVECGVGSNQDTSCASRVKQQFLHDYNSSWADAPGQPSTTNTGVDTSTTASETPIIKRVNIYLKWITAGIGILAVFGLVISGIQYTAAGDDPKAVAEAKKRIANVVIGLFIYMFMFAALQWLVPGGIF